MTPAKRRPAKPASEGPQEAATKDSTPLLGPDGEPIDQEAPAGDASGDSARPAETEQTDPEERAPTQSPRRSRGLPTPVWPD